MSLFEITDTAKAQIERLLEKNPDKYAVSLSVLGGGCAGFKYDWGFSDTQESVSKDDHIEVDSLSMRLLCCTWRAPR